MNVNNFLQAEWTTANGLLTRWKLVSLYFLLLSFQQVLLIAVTIWNSSTRRTMTQGEQMFKQSLRDLPWILPIVTTQELVYIFFLLMIAYIALFSALLSRLTALAYDSTWVTWVTGFLQRVFWISTEVVCLSAGMAGASWNCCCFGESSVYTIQSCTMHFRGCVG